MVGKKIYTTEEALLDVFISPNESDSNGEAANVVDGLFAIARSLRKLAGAIEKVDETLNNKLGEWWFGFP